MKSIKEIEEIRQNKIKSHFRKYVVDYKIEDDHIRLISNVGETRLIKNTKENASRLNHVIIENKIAMSKKIDEYADNSKERIIVVLINMFFLGCAGILVPLTLFIGNFYLFLLSIVLFSFATIATSIIIFDYYLKMKEIKNFKNITGYKNDTKLYFSLLNIHIKKNN